MFKKIINTFFLLHLAVICRSLFLGRNVSINVALLLLLIISFFLIYADILSRKFSVFRPGFLFKLWFTLFYCTSSIWIYSKRNFDGILTNINIDLGSSNVVISIILLICSYLLFAIGERIPRFFIRESSLTLRMPFGSLVRRGVLLLYVFSVLFRLTALSSGNLGSLSAASGSVSGFFALPGVSILYFISNLYFLYYFYLLYDFTYFKRSTSLLKLLFVVELLLMLYSGDRRNLIQLLFMHGFMLDSFGGNLRKGQLTWFVVGILVFIPVSTYLGYEMMIQEHYTIQSLLTGVVARMQSVGLGVYGDLADSILISSFGYLWYVVISYEGFYLSGDMIGSFTGLKSLFYQILPGFIPGVEREDVRQYFDIFADKAFTYDIDYSPLTFTMQQQLLFEGGILALFVGSFVLGITMSSLWVIFTANRTPRLLKFIYLGLLYKLSVGFMSGLFVADLVFGIRILVYGLVFWLISRLFLNRNMT